MKVLFPFTYFIVLKFNTLFVPADPGPGPIQPTVLQPPTEPPPGFELHPNC